MQSGVSSPPKHDVRAASNASARDSATMHSNQPSSVGAVSDELPLQNCWTLWYDEKVSKGMERDSYASVLKRLGEFGTVQEFWRYMNHIEVSNLPTGSNLRMFKSGIEPTWEDPANASGGKYVFEVPSGVAIREAWTYTLLALVGETFENNDSICGAVLSLRARNLSTINIWNANAYNSDDIARGEAAIQRLIVAKLAENKRQPVTLQLHYQPHQRSLDWNHLWTQTKSKESVLAQLAAEANPSPRKTLTSSPQATRRSRLAADPAHAKSAALRSSTGSLPTHGHSDAKHNSAQNANSDSPRASAASHPTHSIPHTDAKKSTSASSTHTGGTRATAHSKIKSADLPRNLHASMPIPISHTSHSIDNMDYSTGHSSDANEEEEMRSPLLMLGEARHATSGLDSPATSPNFRPMSPQGANGAHGGGHNSPKNSRPNSGRSSAGTSTNEPLRTHPTTFLKRKPSVDNGDSWASLNSLTGETSGDSDSAASSPRYGLASPASSSFTSPAAYAGAQAGTKEHSSFSGVLLPAAAYSPSLRSNVEPVVQFAEVMQEIKSQWWLNRRYKRRGRPATSASSPLGSSFAHAQLTASNDSQLRVPDPSIVDSGSGAGSGLGNFSGLVLASSLPAEKRKRKRPSRGGSRDKSRSRDASATTNATGAILSPRTVPEDSPLPDDPEVIVHHDIPSNFSSATPVVDSIIGSENEKSQRRRKPSPADASPAALPTSMNVSSESNLNGVEYGEGVSGGGGNGKAPFSPSNAQLERRASFVDEVEIVSTPSVVIVGEDTLDEGQSTANQVRHHRKRSRGRGAGSTSSSNTPSKKSKEPQATSSNSNDHVSNHASSASPAPAHPHTPILQYVQTFAMIFIIILLMVLCYLFGRNQGNIFVSPSLGLHTPPAGASPPHQYIYNAQQAYEAAPQHVATAAAAAAAPPNQPRLNPRPAL